MDTSNIPGGALSLTLANASHYLIVAVFYMIVTKTNSLSETEIGILSILAFLASTFTLLTMLALPTALTKFTSEKLGKNQEQEALETQKTIIKTVFILSIAGLIVAILLSQLISQQLWGNTEFIIILILNFTFSFLSNMRKLCDSIFSALYLFGEMASITVIFIISSRVIAILLIFLKMGVTGVIIGYLIGILLALGIALKFLRGKLPKTTKTAPLKPILSYSFPLFLNQITSLILQSADIVFITLLTGDLSQTGVYSITLGSVGMLSLLYVPMITTIFPAISAHHGLQQPKRITKILKITSRIIIYFLFPSCIGLAIIAPTALTFFYGSIYAVGAIPLSILCITRIIMGLIEPFRTTLTAIGKTRQALKIDLLATTFLIVMLVVLVTLLDITGAAFANLVAQIMILALTVNLLKKDFKIRLDKEALWKSLVSITAFVPFLLIIELILSPKLPTTLILFMEILIAVLIYIFSLYILKALKPQDFNLIRQALPKFLTKYINLIESKFVR